MHPALVYIDRMINGPTCNCVRNANAKVTKATKKALSIVQAEAKWRAEARKAREAKTDC
jgi:hypothetical protein